MKSEVLYPRPKGLLGASAPDISLIDCNGNDADLCLKVDFASSSDIAELSQQGSTCTFIGHFKRGDNSRVFVSSTNGCPILENSSFDVSFVDSRCPDNHFFHVSQGIAEVAYIQQTSNITDISMKPPFANENAKKIQGSMNEIMSRTSFPANGYDLHLKVFYDTDFLAEFSSDFETR